MNRCVAWSLFVVFGLASAAAAQAPTEEQAAAIEVKLQGLRASIDELAAGDVQERDIVDIEVYAKAAEWILRHDEFYRPNYADNTLAALATGVKRAAALSGGSAEWGRSSGKWALGYRSEVDGSVQPYVVSLPAGFDPTSRERRPLHVVLHGRGGTLNEVSFIVRHDGKPVPDSQTWIQLDVFGRVNNAYRWAGETDVFEAIADVTRRYRIDEKRITLWGFSMGGAGAWHLGLHHPTKWSSVGAGAGFVDFYKYQNVTEQLPDYQHRTLRIYDATDYASNLANVPFITYGGELDKQLAASLRMQDLAEEQDVPLDLLIGAGMGHKFDDESFAKFMAFHARHAEAGRPAYPGRREIQFVTHTLKYNQCEWLTIQELDQSYEAATVRSTVADDGTLELMTENVTAVSLLRDAADQVTLDGSERFPLYAAADQLLPEVYFVRDAEGWEQLEYDDSLEFTENPDVRKRHNLQGPIDDAFMQPFVCVRGTGTAWNESHEAWATWSLARFEREWDKWMRGQAPVIDDGDVTEELIASKNLALFGDPASNSLIRQVVEGLPLTWTEKTIEFGGTSYEAGSHGVCLIFPNPLNASRYVVINSGMTTHEKDFLASNSWLFPKLGDAAVIRYTEDSEGGFEEETVFATLFTESWTLP